MKCRVVVISFLLFLFTLTLQTQTSMAEVKQGVFYGTQRWITSIDTIRIDYQDPEGAGIIVEGNVQNCKENDQIGGEILLTETDSFYSSGQIDLKQGQQDFRIRFPIPSKELSPIKDGDYYVILTNKTEDSLIPNESFTFYFKVNDEKIITEDIDFPKIEKNHITQNSSVDDITDHWAENDIRSLIEKKVIKGYEDGTFRPNGEITRAEFAQIVKVAFDYEGTAHESHFRDVLKDDWFFHSIMVLNEKGIIEGTSSNSFMPNDLITREQMAAILYRVIENNAIDNMKIRENLIFSDSAKISKYAETAVKTLYEMGIVNGVEVENQVHFYPDKYATRAEAAVMLNKILNRIE